MATQTQLRRGTAAQNNSFTGAVGELSYDTENKSVRVHDGSTAGGIEVLTGNGDISAKTSDGAALTLETSDTTVTDGSVLGKIEFKAPNEASGTDALLVGAAIEAVAEGTFAADNNATELVFKTGASAAATTKMVLTSGGNFGIGTSAPAEHLEISAAANNFAKVTATNNNTRAGYLSSAKKSDGTEIQTWIRSEGDGGIGVVFTQTNHNLGFATNNAAPQMTLNTSGNFGIGTSSPTALMHINGGSTAANGIHFVANNTSSGPAGIVMNSGHGNWKIMNSQTVANALEFIDGGSPDVTKMMIDSSGNLLVEATSRSTAARYHQLG